MPEYLTPGLYVSETPSFRRAITGVATHILGMAGETERGPEVVRAVTSYAGFQRLYGDPVADRFLSFAVRGFFENGGQKCFVARVANRRAGTATVTAGALRISAIGPGAAGENLWLWITDAASGHTDRFRLVIAYYPDGVGDLGPLEPTIESNRSIPGFVKPAVVEEYDELVCTASNAGDALMPLAGSNLVRAEWTQAPARPANTGPVQLSGADPGDPVDLDDYLGRDVDIPGSTDRATTGLSGLAKIDEIALLALPDEHLVAGLRQHAIKQCVSLGDRFGIFSVARDSRDAGSINEPHPPSSMGAVYWPWIRVTDPLTRALVTAPPVGHVAGIFAKTDITRGVHKAPANEVVSGAMDLELQVTPADQDILNPRGVNVIRDFRASNRGIRLWGARTMSSDPEWKYINVRRFFLYLEESVGKGTRWAVFEPNAEPLWGSIRNAIENFLMTSWREGALQGAKPEQAFFVKCDRTTMTQDDIDNGRLICEIGIAPVKPAEFIIFRIFQSTARKR